MEATMKRASGIIGASILAISIYFALFWGYDALRILTSPTYGLEDVWRSQVVFGIGRYTGLGPEGLLRLAAALGAMKLAIAGVCAIHVFDRLRRLFSGSAPANDMLETALIVAVGISIVSVVPAIWSQNADLMREQTVQLVIAAITGVFCVVERRKTEQSGKAAPAVGADSTYAPWHR
jgi:hypothetical protein